MLETESGKTVYVRSIYKSRGNSISVCIPQKLAKLLDISCKDSLIIEFDEDNDRLILRKLHLEDM